MNVESAESNGKKRAALDEQLIARELVVVLFVLPAHDPRPPHGGHRNDRNERRVDGG